MTEGNRIRVLLAGNVYAKRTLVRRILEDAGYEVVGDVTDPGPVLEVARATRPDVVILDEDLVPQGVRLEDVRATVPDVRVVVSTSVVPGRGAPPPGADGYLDKGMGLSALTALLGRLFAAPIPVTVGTVAGTTEGSIEEGSMQDTQPITPPGGGRSRAGTYRTAAIVAGLLLIVWGVVTAVTSERAPRGGTVAEPGREAEGGGIVQEPPTVTALDRAEDALDAMVAALEDGNYILAAVEAQNLMRYREQAIAEGFSVRAFDAAVTARLEILVPDLPQRVASRLSEILGGLFPVLEAPISGGGSTLVLGSTVTNGTSGGTSEGGAGGGTSGGSGGGTSGGSGGTGGDSGGGSTLPPQPGDGKVWGQWHKEHKGEGGPPPWAKAWGHKR